jgi:hypothetical protein
MIVHSNGFGVQSVTIAAMACLGDLPMPDHSFFADPGWESAATYSYIPAFTAWAAERGLKIETLRTTNIRADALDAGKRFASMPFYTKGAVEDGMIRRQCTNEYKIQVVRRAIRKALGLAPRKRSKIRPIVWLGISTDEIERMKESREKWLVHAWPLIDKRMNRADCLRYLSAHGIPQPPKSSCIGCPYHSDRHWKTLKETNPVEWADAVDFDNRIRKTRVAIKAPVYLHRSCKPLEEVDFGADHPDMFGNECGGHCGL